MKLVFIFALILSSFAHAQLTYPVAKKINQVETRFGVVIEDPYKWMENPSDSDLWDWIDEQKALTNSYLDASLFETFATRVSVYRKLRTEQNVITEAAVPGITSLAIPSTEDVGKNQSRLIRWETTKSNSKSLTSKIVSSLYEIKKVAVASGDLARIIITQKADNKLADILLVKFFTFITWADDNSFYYLSDMDERLGGGRQGVFKHTVGQIQSEDQLLLTGKASNSDIVIHDVNNSFFAEVDGSIGSFQLATGKITNRQPVDGNIVEMNNNSQVEATILSFKNANFGEFHKLRLRDGNRRVFVKEQDFVLEKTKKLNEESTLIIGLKDGAHVAGIYDIFGTIKMIPLLDGTIDLVSFAEGVLKLGHETFSHPRKVYSFNLLTQELKILAAQVLPVEIESEKITYTAANGAPATIWLMRKKGVKLTSTTPTILYGYGGFRVQLTPAFGMYESLPWMEQGGAFAVVTLPGSLDYGESWYQLARVGGRINSWDSFALAAKELFKRGLTSAEHIGMLGASNGGTLVSGTLARHSDTFKAAVPLVGVHDLINFTLFTAGKYWTDDYGNPFIEKDFHTMYPLSPYHNLAKRPYPATMVMTAEFDDRVVPMHSYKYLARLQEYNTSDAPILLYNKEWGGHARASGSARESSRYVSAYYTFFAQQLGL